MQLRRLLPLLLLTSAFAATHPAATCNTTDVQAAINLSSAGDTVTVPVGTCTWSASGVTVGAAISIIGPGGTATVLNDAIPTGASTCNMFKISGTAIGALVRVSGLVLQPVNSSVCPAISAQGTCNSTTCSQIRVDNIAFSGWATVTRVGNSFGINVIGDMFGVFDHNTINGVPGNYLQLVEINNGSYQGIGSYGDNAWHQPEAYGTANFMYFENNTFNTAGCCENEGSVGGINTRGGARVIARFNTFNNMDGLNFALGWHGTESNGRGRSGRTFEFYNNTYTCPPTVSCGQVAGVRGGTGMVWGNTANLTSAGLNNMFTFTTYRAFSSIGGWGACDGASVYDTDDGTTYYSGAIGSYNAGTGVITVSGSPGWTTNQWTANGAPYSVHDVTQNNGTEISASGSNTLTIVVQGGPGPWTPANGDSIQILRATRCIDQAGGRGAGILYSATDPATPASPANEAASPSYLFMNGFNGNTPLFNTAQSGVGSDTARVIRSRDYYVESTNQTAQTTTSVPFDGTNTLGVGHGTLALRPATCTTGVGYWATDQGSWNVSGSGGQGLLYTCVSTNTWSVTYTPYTYPNPLTSGGPPPPGPPNLGQNCTNGCGIGTHILPNTLTVTLCDTANSGCASTIPAQKTVSDYPTLPTTINAQCMNFDWQTDVPANGEVVCGALLNNSDSIQFDTSAPGVYNIGTTHHVTFCGLVPASHGGNGGGGETCYVADNINATSSDPQQRYATGQNTWPGPQCYAGSTNCYLNFFPPNPTNSLPMQWTAATRGIISATRGDPAEIPLMLLWNGGNATTAPSSCSTANQLFHTYASGQWSAPNSGTWYKCIPPNWTTMGSQLPVFAVTGNTITDPSSNTYTCPASANGGESASGIPRVPADTCTGSAGDSHISVTPFYTGTYVSGSPQTDYRQIFYRSSPVNAYYFNTNGAAPPSNPVPVSTVQFFPATNAPTGNYTGTVTLTMYTDSTLTTPAAGTSPITFSYAINVSDDTPIPQVNPGFYPADTNLPSWMNYLSQQSIYMCSNASGPDSMDYYNLGINYWMWLTFSGGDWGPFQTGNYDNSRVFAAASDVFLHQMDGTAWPNWASGTTYGTSQATMEVTDTNGHIWLATVNGGVSGGSISWPASPTAGSTKTDNTQTWRYVGDLPYWNRCTENASVPFDNQSIQAGGTPDWAKFSGAEEMHRLRTGNAIQKGTTTYTGFYSTAESKQVGLGGGYWSEYSPAAGRGSAYRGMALATIWQADCDAGNCATFTGSDELKRAWFWNINACIEFLQIHQLSNPLVTDPTKTAWPTFDPLHVGVCQEALREMYITDLRLDPTNAQHLADPRIIPEMTKFADFAYFHFYNQCRVQGEGTDNWSMSYNPMDVQQCKYSGQNGISEPYYTELVGPGATVYPFLGRYNGNALMSDSSTHWFSASDIILKHVYDGRTCNNPQGQWYCQTYSTPYAGASGVPKAFGQGAQREMGNFYQYRTGAYTPFEDDLSPNRNPCWDTLTVPCAGNHPYPDTEAPYGFQLHANGSEQDDPTCEANYTGDAACSPIINVTANSAIFRINFYEPLASLRVDYGTDQTCTGGSSTAEVGGFPAPINSANQSHADQIQLSGLSPSTTIWARYCAVDLAGIQSCNTCTAIPGGFRGGKINFTTATQTLLTIVTTSPLPNGSLNVAYGPVQLQAAGGTPPYTWSYTGTLPTGLSLSSSGLISGTPTQSGAFTINVSVADSATHHAGPVPLSLTITDLTITTTSLPNGAQGVLYDQTLTVSGGTPPYTWGVVAGILPSGLTLNTSTGEIRGTPTICKTFPIVFKVTDSSTPTPISATKSLPITITGCTGSVNITAPSPLPNGIVGQVYPAQTYIANGGTPPYTWSISSGSLPTGLALGSSTGSITGTPTVAGTYTFTVLVTDSTTPTPLTASAPNQQITVISPGQLGLTVNGAVSITGSTTLGTVPTPPPPGSPIGP